MKSKEWRTCTDRKKMLRVLRQKGSDRTRRLFACVLCRRIWHLIDEGPCRKAVEASEKFADGKLSEAKLVAAQKATWTATHRDETRSQANLAAARVARTVGVDDAMMLAVWAAEVEIEEKKKRVAATRKALQKTHCDLIRCVLGDPFAVHEPALEITVNGTVRRLATGIYAEVAFDRMPILGDALEEAGCTDASILDHCRGPGSHVRGCWVSDLVLGKS
jgi:hypothetical protein